MRQKSFHRMFVYLGRALNKHNPVTPLRFRFSRTGGQQTHRVPTLMPARMSLLLPGCIWISLVNNAVHEAAGVM